MSRIPYNDLICDACGETKHPDTVHPFCAVGGILGGILGGVVGGHLGSPTPEQIDHDIIGELISLRQKIADLETAKNFHMACIENIVERLGDVEQEGQARFAKGYHAGRESVLRENKSGCCCIVNDSDEIVSVCGAHEQWGDNLLQRLNDVEGKLRSLESAINSIELSRLRGNG